jgi:hypothetical protein
MKNDVKLSFVLVFMTVVTALTAIVLTNDEAYETCLKTQSEQTCKQILYR